MDIVDRRPRQADHRFTNHWDYLTSKQAAQAEGEKENMHIKTRFTGRLFASSTRFVQAGMQMVFGYGRDGRTGRRKHGALGFLETALTHPRRKNLPRKNPAHTGTLTDSRSA